MRKLSSSTLGSVKKIRETPDYHLIDTRHAGGLRLEQHAHERAGITMVMAGSYLERHGRTEMVCGSRSIVFKPAGVVHSNRYGQEGAHALHLELADNVLIDSDLPLPDRVTDLSDPRAYYIAAQMRREIRLFDVDSRLTLDALSLELISLVVRASRHQEHPGTAPRWLGQAIELLRERYHEAPSLRDVSMAINVPTRRVAREFRRRFGCSVGKYARRIRIEGAARRLRESTEPIAFIAIDAGFFDQPHFTHVFRCELGVTPAEYRRLCRQ